MSDPLGGLIRQYEKAWAQNPEPKFPKHESVVSDLKKVNVHRNVLCHSSWQRGSDNDTGKPRFIRKSSIDKKPEIFDGTYNVTDLGRLRQSTREIIAGVMNSVTLRGVQFPGSSGPGKPVW